jgi:23S rRNA pseudouridine2605 synthase
MFLNKFLSLSGITSRRKAVDEIKAGRVMVNSEIIRDPSYKVKEGDSVAYKGKKIGPEKHIYILLNKPEGYITAVSDVHGRQHVMDLIKRSDKTRLFPIGRLDKNTTGLLLITNDGDLGQKLAHPKYEVSKVYEVVLDQEFNSALFPKLLKGVRLKDGVTKVDRVFYTKKPNRKKVSIEIHSGKNRIVRRLFKALGYNVVKLDRVKYAGLSKRGIKRGEWRYLSDVEVKQLKLVED